MKGQAMKETHEQFMRHAFGENWAYEEELRRTHGTNWKNVMVKMFDEAIDLASGNDYTAIEFCNAEAKEPLNKLDPFTPTEDRYNRTFQNRYDELHANTMKKYSCSASEATIRICTDAY